MVLATPFRMLSQITELLGIISAADAYFQEIRFAILLVRQNKFEMLIQIHLKYYRFFLS